MPISAELIFAAVISFIGGIVWMVRLEGRINGQGRELELTNARVDTLQGKHDSLDSRIVNDLARLREGVARIEGYLHKIQE